ncbi:hypothetical protein PG984_005449 [Apiospora sp. TS-2023a]
MTVGGKHAEVSEHDNGAVSFIHDYIPRFALSDNSQRSEVLNSQLEKLAPDPRTLKRDKLGLHELAASKNRHRWGDYFALSYEWGDPTAIASIVVDGVATNVTRNLQEALKHICGTYWSGQDYEDNMYFWADAICINQRDISERNSQVRLMGDIYTQAKAVCTWTGPGFELESEVPKVLDGVRDIFSTGVNSDGRALFAREYLPGWSILQAIAGRSYWRRLWIIQEQLLARTKSIIFLSSSCISLLDFLLAMCFLVYQTITIVELQKADDTFFPDFNPAFTGHLALLEIFYSFDYVCQGTPNPLRVLQCGARAQQKDKRDKIYGLLSLMDPVIKNAIEVDYRKPYTVVYQDFARCMVEKTGRLDLIYQLTAYAPHNCGPQAIGQGDHSSIDNHMPSWVPDWSSSLAVSGNPMDSGAIFGVLTLMFQHRCADSDTSHLPQTEAEPNRLTCRGFFFDTVDGLGCSRNAAECHDEHDLVASRRSEGEFPVAGGMASMKDAVWQCMTLGALKDLGIDAELVSRHMYFPNIEYRPGEISQPEVTIARWQRCNKQFEVSGVPLSAFFATDSAAAGRYGVEGLIMQHSRLSWFLILVMMVKRIMTTTRGYVGMTPKASKQGDSIFLLKGCNMPLVLRPYGDGSYRLVGECFVHGIMDGEAMDQFLQDDSVEEMNVVLR